MRAATLYCDRRSGCGKRHPVPLECDSRAPLSPMAQRLPPLAYRDLYRPTGAHHRCRGLFPLRLAGEVESASLPPLGGRVAPARLDSPAVRTAIVAARHAPASPETDAPKVSIVPTVLSGCEITTCGRTVGAPRAAPVIFESGRGRLASIYETIRRSPRPSAHLPWPGPANRSTRKPWRRQQQRHL